MVQKMAFVAYSVRDVAAAKTFYRDTIGLTLQRYGFADVSRRSTGGTLGSARRSRWWPIPARPVMRQGWLLACHAPTGQRPDAP